MKKVYVAMSGGVDSSVSALLLKNMGYSVFGVFIKGWYPEFINCSWRQERTDAMKVCAQLQIPFETLNAESAYKKYVIDYMVGEYKSGRTPNSDIFCNKFIKFGEFYSYAKNNGADFIATGHYALSKNGRLFTARDTKKDQTYFLWAIPSEALKHTIFPVGEYKKGEIRTIAKKNGLVVAEKRDSQGICFLGKVDLKDFLENYINAKKGDVLDSSGNVIGTHDGAIFYTLGQRHGFVITKKDSYMGKHYVVAKNTKNNTIVVSENPRSEKKYLKDKLKLVDTNWLGDVPKNDEEYKCKFRYRGELMTCEIKNKHTVILEKPKYDIAIGQSLVIYKGNECLGGGTISD